MDPEDLAKACAELNRKADMLVPEGIKTLLLKALRRLAFCPHPVDKTVEDTCIRCGATRLPDSGWALPLDLQDIRELIESWEAFVQSAPETAKQPATETVKQPAPETAKHPLELYVKQPAPETAKHPLELYVKQPAPETAKQPDEKGKRHESEQGQ